VLAQSSGAGLHWAQVLCLRAFVPLCFCAFVFFPGVKTLFLLGAAHKPFFAHVPYLVQQHEQDGGAI
jgi:hypothetical protein